MTKGKPWENEEEKRLKELVLAGRSVRAIAKALGKTRDSVRIKIARLGLEEEVLAKTERTTSISLELPKELPSVEDVLKKLSAALSALETAGLDQSETLRLRSIISGIKVYKEMFADYLDYSELENRLAELEAKYAENDKNKKCPTNAPA
jgi:hypothetical protein